MGKRRGEGERKKNRKKRGERKGEGKKGRLEEKREKWGRSGRRKGKILP